MKKLTISTILFLSLVEIGSAQSYVEPALLKDINPNGDSRIAELTVVGNQVFFFAADSANNSKLWKSDGSPEGTVLVKEINPGPIGDWVIGLQGNGTSMLSLHDTAYFFAFREDVGYELWKSAGHDTNTVLVKDINPGAQGVHPPGSLSPKYNPIIFQEHYYFVAYRADLGYEIWRSDGSEAGTIPVTNIPGNSSSIFPFQVEVIGDRIFFSINASGNSPQLGFYATDGTPGNEVHFSNLFPSGVIPTPARFFTELGDWIYFPAGTESGSVELYRVSQNLDTVELFNDFNQDGNGSPREFFYVNDGFTFRARNSVNEGPSNLAFRCDGTLQGLQVLNDENGEPIAAQGTGLLTERWLGWNNQVLFEDEDFSIWRGNGQQNGSIRLGIYGEIEGVENTGINKTSAVFGNQIVFQMDDTSNYELIILTDGTPANTFSLLDPEMWTLWRQMILKGDTLFVVLEDESDNGVGMELYSFRLIDLPTGLKPAEALIEQEVNLYPNPSSGIVNLPAAGVNSVAEIRNYQGQLVERVLVDAQGSIELNPSNPPGIYFVTWIDANTNRENHAKLLLSSN